MSRTPLPANCTLKQGVYRNVNLLSDQGAMSLVYKAEDTTTNDPKKVAVAIKEFYPETLSCSRTNVGARGWPLSPMANKQQTFDRWRNEFLKEAKHLMAISHPNVVEMREPFIENNTVYIVLEFINGKTLRETVKPNESAPTQPLTWQQAIPLFLQIVEPLERLHHKDILHQDVSYNNVMLTLDEDSKEKLVLTDFGNARKYEVASGRLATVAYTPGCGAPEQQNEDDVSKRGPWTDVYGLAATFRYAITGSIEPSVLRTIRGVPFELVELLERATHNDIEKRPQTISEFAEALELFVFPQHRTTHTSNGGLRKPNPKISPKFPPFTSNPKSVRTPLPLSPFIKGCFAVIGFVLTVTILALAWVAFSAATND